MNTKKSPKIVQYWADNHLVVSGSLYQLIDNITQKEIVQFKAASLSEAHRKCYQFIRYGRVA